MGYCMNQGDSRIFIAKSNREELHQCLITMAQYAHKAHHGHFSWVDTSTLEKARNDLEALEEWRWDAGVNAAGDIVSLDFTGEKLGDDLTMFKVIAPLVKQGSFIVMHGEDGESWRWYFNGETCLEQSASLSFAEVQDGDIIDGDAHVVADPKLLRSSL